MAAKTIDEFNKDAMIDSFAKLENSLDSDVFVYFGALNDGIEADVKKIIENLKSDSNTHNRLVVLLTTPGGSLSPVERIVNIFRHFYDTVDFIIPDYAYSAGTVMACSADHIFMDYHGVLGPIDPQVQNKDGRFVAALGYLDKINDLITKAQGGTLTDAEFVILKDFDLAELRSYEQARDYAIDLLETWLATYKFKNWITHSSTNLPVTEEDRKSRAHEIGMLLSDNNKWKSHGRPLNRNLLCGMKLIIDNLEDNRCVYNAVQDYHELMLDYTKKYGMSLFIQTRRFL